MKIWQSLALLFLLASCGPRPALLPTPVQATTEPATSIPSSAEPTLSFEPALYADNLGRFEISYPQGWMVDGAQAGSRGSYVQITSWQHDPGGFSEIPSGGSLLQITIYQWEPVRDLDARVEMRRANFLDSGNLILEEEVVIYPGDHRGVRFLLQDTEGNQSVVVLLELGDDYLELSGSGDLAILDEMIRTLRFN